MPKATYNPQGTDDRRQEHVLMSIGYKDHARLRGGETLRVNTDAGLIGIRHADRKDDDGITSGFVWPDREDVPYDRCLTVTERSIKKLKNGDLSQDFWHSTDTFPRVYLTYV